MNLKTALATLSLITLPLALAVGCGGDDIFGTNKLDGGTTGTAYKLLSGEYLVTDLRNKMDGCMIDTDQAHPILGSKFTVTNDGHGNVEIKGFGKGTISNNGGMLSSSGSTSAGTCSYNYVATNQLTLTGDSQFSALYSETDSNRLATCVPNVGMTCTTSWIMDMKLSQ